MKKILSITLPIALSLVSYNLLIFNQVFATPNEAWQNYNANLEKYRNSYKEYSKSKDIYLTYKTLSSQTEALAKTKLFLEVRDDLLISYFSLLKERLINAAGITPFRQGLKVNTIDNRLVFLENHKSTIPPVASLTDVLEKSQEVDKIAEIITIEGNQIIGEILVGKVRNQASLIDSQIKEVSALVNQIKTLGRDVIKLERWLIETSTKYELAQKKLREAETLLDNLNSSASDKDFIMAKKLISEGNQYLKETVHYAKEASLEIKTGPY